MKFTLASIIAVASLTAVNAQIGGVGISACVFQCTTEAATNAGCTGISDISCVCTSADFQNAATACLASNCSESEQQGAVQLQQQLCQGQSASGSLSSTISAPSASSSLDAGAISSLSESLAMTSAPSGSASGASASVGSLTSAGGSAASGASASVSGGIDSATSAISSITGAPNGATKADLNIKWGVLGAGAVGMAVGALAVF